MSFLSELFRKDDSEDSYLSSYGNSDSFHHEDVSTDEPMDQEDTEDSNDQEDDEESQCDLDIKFKKELSNNALLFTIVDDDYDWIGGYVIVSPRGITSIIPSTSYELNDYESRYLKSKAKLFYDAMRTTEVENS